MGYGLFLQVQDYVYDTLTAEMDEKIEFEYPLRFRASLPLLFFCGVCEPHFGRLCKYFLCCTFTVTVTIVVILRSFTHVIVSPSLVRLVS